MTDVVPEPDKKPEVQPAPADTPTTPEPTKQDPPADKPAPTQEPDKKEEDETKYHEYEDPEAQAIVEVLKASNLPAKDAKAIFDKANETGKLEDINVAALTEKLGPAQATLVMSAIKSYHARVSEANAAVDQAVFGTVGGEGNMQLIATWALDAAKANPAFADKLTSYHTMLKSGPVQAELAARELLTAYNNDPKNNSIVVKQVEGTSSKASPLAPITQREYAEKRQDAQRRNDVAAVAELDRRMLASMGVKQ